MENTVGYVFVAKGEARREFPIFSSAEGNKVLVPIAPGGHVLLDEFIAKAEGEGLEVRVYLLPRTNEDKNTHAQKLQLRRSGDDKERQRKRQMENDRTPFYTSPEAKPDPVMKERPRKDPSRKRRKEPERFIPTPELDVPDVKGESLAQSPALIRWKWTEKAYEAYRKELARLQPGETRDIAVYRAREAADNAYPDIKKTMTRSERERAMESLDAALKDQRPQEQTMQRAQEDMERPFGRADLNREEKLRVRSRERGMSR